MRLAGEPVGDAARVVGGVRHRLEPDWMSLAVLAREGRAIADRRNIAVGGQQLCIDDDAVRHFEPGGSGQLFVWPDADADENEVSGKFPSVGKLDMLDSAMPAGDPGGLRAKAELNTALRCASAKNRQVSTETTGPIARSVSSTICTGLP